MLLKVTRNDSETDWEEMPFFEQAEAFIAPSTLQSQEHERITFMHTYGNVQAFFQKSNDLSRML